MTDDVAEQDVAETPLQRFVSEAIYLLPKTRNFYDRQIQAALGTTGKPLYDLDRRGGVPKRETLKVMADALGQPLELMLRAVDGEEVTPVSPLSGKSQSQRQTRLPDTIDKAPDQPPTLPADGGETASIATLDLSYAMGDGTSIDDYIEETSTMFDVSFLRRRTRAEFTRLRLARGVGDSMFPTLLTNDVVLIDTTQNQLNAQDGVYAIALYGAAAIKRLRRAGPQTIIVKSDNPAVDDQTVDADAVRIHGRVIWFGRDL